MLVYLHFPDLHPAWDFPQWALEELSRSFPDHEFHLVRVREWDEDALARAEVIIAWHLPADVFVKAKTLHWLHTPAAGVKRLFYPQMVESEVVLTKGSGLNAEPVAEHVLAMMLAWHRGLHLVSRRPQAYQEDRRLIFDRFLLMGPFGEKRTLIVGFGAIGRLLATHLIALGQRVVGIRRTPTLAVGQSLSLYPLDRLEELLPEVDFVVNLLPLTEETRGFFNRERFQLMKESACLVNAGRGATVVEEDLVWALRERKIAGACLDVFAKEPLPEDSPLWQMREVLISPHVAATCADPWGPQLELIKENLSRYLEGGPLLNQVDKGSGY